MLSVVAPAGDDEAGVVGNPGDGIAIVRVAGGVGVGAHVCRLGGAVAEEVEHHKPLKPPVLRPELTLGDRGVEFLRRGRGRVEPDKSCHARNRCVRLEPSPEGVAVRFDAFEGTALADLADFRLAAKDGAAGGGGDPGFICQQILRVWGRTTSLRRYALLRRKNA